MTLFRLRVWGSADWLTLSFDGDDEELEGQLETALTNLFSTAFPDLHIQQLVDGEWEDLE